jgi:hypothetical protein
MKDTTMSVQMGTTATKNPTDIVLSLPSSEDYNLECSEKSFEIFDYATQVDYLPTQFDHVCIVITNVVDAPFSVAGKVAWIGAEAFMTITCLVRLNGKDALYHFLNTLILDPLEVATTTISAIVRVISAILGIASPNVSLHGFRVAEIIDFFILQSKVKLFRLIAPDEQNGILTESDIQPSGALSYFSKKDCLKLTEEQKSTGELLALDKEILQRISNLVRCMLEKDRKRVESMFYFREVKQKQLVGHEDLKPILEKLFKTSTTIDNLPEKIGALATSSDAKKIYELITRELFLPGTDDARENAEILPILQSGANALLNAKDPKGLSNEDNPLNFTVLQSHFKPIDRLLKTRFEFGSMVYRMH